MEEITTACAEEQGERTHDRVVSLVDYVGPDAPTQDTQEPQSDDLQHVGVLEENATTDNQTSPKRSENGSFYENEGILDPDVVGYEGPTAYLEMQIINQRVNLREEVEEEDDYPEVPGGADDTSQTYTEVPGGADDTSQTYPVVPGGADDTSQTYTEVPGGADDTSQTYTEVPGGADDTSQTYPEVQPSLYYSSIDNRGCCHTAADVESLKVKKWKFLAVAVVTALVVVSLLIGFYLIMKDKCGKSTADISTTVDRDTSADLTTTTAANPLQYCVTAANLTEEWRQDHNGSDYRPGGDHSHITDRYACDLHEDLQWFRFTGAAGNRMLDSCPKWKSCGTKTPMWTDDVIPKSVGVTYNIDVYVVAGEFCRIDIRHVQAIRCSLHTDYDIIYKYIPDYGYSAFCTYAFCGMT